MKRSGKIAIFIIVAVVAFFLLKPYIIGKGGKKIEVVKDSVTVDSPIIKEDGTTIPATVPKKELVKPAVKPPPKKVVKEVEKKEPVKKKKGKERENLDINI